MNPAFVSRLSIPLLALVSAGLLLGAARMNGPLRAARKAAGITQADPLKNAPPLVAFTTVVLGGFRGILADFLWMRSSTLQEEGRYFELVQLADWITKLEPRFTSVWAFHAWNLAYNVSVLFPDAADRWRWVSHGVSLLRDEGLLYNPGDARLLYELGWMFQHKIGGNSDNAHMFYKQAWAAEMATLFDGPAPDYTYLESLSSSVALKDTADALRVERMRSVYKLEPSIMRTVDAQYGPLDWRLPQAHALYWAWQSRQIAKGFDAVAADRMIFQSMADAFRMGRLFTGKDGKVFIPSPNLDLIPRVREAFLDAIVRHEDEATMKAAYANFLAEAIVALFTYNRVEESRAIFEELEKADPSRTAGKDFEEFVYAGFLEDVEGKGPEALSLIESAFSQSFQWQAIGDEDRAAGYDRLARLLWARYMKPRMNDPEWKERTGLPPIEEIQKSARQKTLEAMPAPF
jgi:hypothetical protein